MTDNPRKEVIQRSIELRKMFGAQANNICEVEFFFYADKVDCVLDLMNKLRKMGYSAECVRSEYGNKKFLVTGNTPSMNMQSNEILDWLNQMDDLAAEFDCEFDGWGAPIEKEETADKKRENRCL